MKKHEHPSDQPSGRGGHPDPNGRTGRGDGSYPTPGGRLNDAPRGRRSGLSGDGYHDRGSLSGDSDRLSGSRYGTGARVQRGRQKRSRLPVILALVALLVIGALVFRPLVSGLFGTTGPSTGGPGTTTKQTPTGTSTISSGSGATTSPSTASPSTTGTGTATSATAPSATTVDAATRAQAFSKAKADFEALVKNYKGRYALYYHNLANGETYAYNAEAPFVAASSIKLGINTYLYTQIEAGKVSSTETLTYDSRPYPTGDYEAGTGTIQGKPNGTPFSVRDTSGLSIRISDNCGTNMVIRRLGGIDTVNTYLSSVSAVVDYRKSVSYRNWSGTTASGRHRTSATDLGRHAVRLFDLYKKNPTLYGTLIDDLKKTEFDFGIQKGIPAGVDVAHKIGTNGTYNTENDVGIVFTPEPFALAVMTESGNAGTAHQFQAKAARIFYDYIESIT